MFRTLILIAAIFLGLIHASFSKPTVIVASRPMELIARHIAGIKANVVNIAPDSVLPWLYKPSTADILRARAADAVIILSPEIEKWAAVMPSIKLIICMDLLPGKYKIKTRIISDSTSLANDSLATQAYNPFFWTDPMAVKEIVQAIADTLAAADPDNAVSYTTNAGLFAKRLDLLDRQAAQMLAESTGKPLAIYDRSLEYFTNRYKLVSAAYLITTMLDNNTISNLDSVLKIIKDIEAKFVFYTNYTPEFIIPMVSSQTTTNKIILNPLAIETKTEKALKKEAQKRNYPDMILDIVRKFRLGLE